MPKKIIKKSIKNNDSDYEDNDIDDEIEPELDPDIEPELDIDLDLEPEIDQDIDGDDIDDDENIIDNNDEDDIFDDDDNCNIEDYINNDIDQTIIDPDNMKKKTNIDTYNYLPNNKRISRNYLTRYEMVRILGERTKQLTMGAKIFVKNYNSLPYDKIAEEEFKLNMIPFKIRRPLPNDLYELWEFDELKKDHLLYLLE